MKALSLDNKYQLLCTELGSERVKTEELISYHSFSRLGGRARFFYIATTEAELLKILDLSLELKLPFMVMGSGTKISISNNGFDGIFIKNRTSNIKVNAIKGKVGKDGIGVEEAIVSSDSGVSLEKFNSFLKEQKLIEVNSESIKNATLGSLVFTDLNLMPLVEKVKVWVAGNIENLDYPELVINKHVVISINFRVKAKGITQLEE